MPIDLFAQLKPDAQLHPQFRLLRDSPIYEPARGMLREISRDLTDPDGNLVEQFQTTGFDSRTFEIFLYVMFRSLGHTVARDHKRPDFSINRNGTHTWVEAVTANPNPADGIKPYKSIPAPQGDNVANFLQNEVAVRLGSPLFTKLRKKYWELPHVAGEPLVFAIENFNGDGALAISSTPLAHYLFGVQSNWYRDERGNLVVTAAPVAEHKTALKRIPSGFFSQPGAENISAVLFCNSGTIPKFNRMGFEGAHRSPAVRMIRWGTAYRPDPNARLPEPFIYEVGHPDWIGETWREGTVLIRNPNALHPLPDEWLGAAVEENLVDGRIVSTFAEPFHPYMSITVNFPGRTPTGVMQHQVDDDRSNACGEIWPAVRDAGFSCGRQEFGQTFRVAGYAAPM
jgi:hypothetical protein